MGLLERFIQNGYCEFDLSDVDHEIIFKKMNSLEKREYDDFLINLIPELITDVIRHPMVVNALKMILGESYVEHPHTMDFLGDYKPNLVAHRDWRLLFDRNRITYKPWYHSPWNRHHHCRLVHLMYCPYLKESSKAGVGVFPGSQYYVEEITPDLSVEPYRMRGSGKVILTHSDIYHRAYQELLDYPRHIFKCMFMRSEEPKKNEYTKSTFSWDNNIHVQKVYDYHWSWYHGQNYEFNNDEYEYLDENSEQTKNLYRNLDIDENNEFNDEIVLKMISISLNKHNTDKLIEMIDKELNWQKRATYIDVLSNMGIGTDELVNKWLDWIVAETSGCVLKNLISGMPIVCQGNSDSLFLLTDRVKNLNIPRGNICIVEFLQSFLKMSKTCSEIPDISSMLYNWNMDKDYFVALFSRHLEKNLK